MTKTAYSRKPANLAKQRRIAARVTDEQYALFQRVAALQGRSLTDFVVSTLQEKAMQTVESLEIIRLNAAESRKLAEALLGPAREPNEHLLAAKKLYNETIRH